MAESSKSEAGDSGGGGGCPLPDDVIPDILLRVPANSIGRFRTVCKLWLSVTSDPRFIVAHTSAAPISGFYVQHRLGRRPPEHYHMDLTSSHCINLFSVSDPSLFFLERRTHLRLWSSCNGLLLVQSEGDNLLSVCNPTTQQHHVISHRDNPHLFGFSLAFDPSRSLESFKIFAFQRVQETCQIHVYSSAAPPPSLPWRPLSGNALVPVGVCKGVLWNGSLVWLCSKSLLYALDVERELGRVLPDPGLVASEQCIGVSRGRLHYTARLRNPDSFHILEMESESSGWSLLYRIDVNMIRTRPVYSWPRTVHFLRGRSTRGDKLLVSEPGKIACYHIQSKTLSTVCNVLTSDIYYWDDFHPHAHTLVPLNPGPSQNDWVCWRRSDDKLLVSLMLHHRRSRQPCGPDGPDFSDQAWHDILGRFNTTTHLNFDVGHLRRRLFSYWEICRKVKRMRWRKGFTWDRNLQMLIAGEAEWERYILRYPADAVFRRWHVPFSDLNKICG